MTAGSLSQHPISLGNCSRRRCCWVLGAVLTTAEAQGRICGDRASRPRHRRRCGFAGAARVTRSRARPPENADDEAGAPDRVDIYVGWRIRARRSLLDIGQPALARTLGLTFQQVQKYENGTNRVSASRLAAIAEALGVTPAYFYEGIDKANEPLSEEDVRWEERIRESKALELVRHYYAIPNSRIRERFLELIKAAAAASVTD